MREAREEFLRTSSCLFNRMLSSQLSINTSIKAKMTAICGNPLSNLYKREYKGTGPSGTGTMRRLNESFTPEYQSDQGYDQVLYRKAGAEELYEHIN